MDKVSSIGERRHAPGATKRLEQRFLGDTTAAINNSTENTQGCETVHDHSLAVNDEATNMRIIADQ